MIARKHIYLFLLLILFSVNSINIGVAQQSATPTMGSGGGSSNPLGGNLPGMNFGRGGSGANIPTDSFGNIKSTWDDTPAKVYYTSLESNIKKHIDTTLTFFHRNSRITQWGRTLGNDGQAAYDMIFNPVQQIGMRTGYHAYDFYKIHPEQLKFYNTTKPFSDFHYMLGPKRQQFVKLLHSQNITPSWNFAGEVINLNSPGVYKFQHTRNLIGHFSTNYISNNKRYQLKSALIYHRFKQDENGGIYDSLLNIPAYNNRSLIGVHFPGRNFSTSIPAVQNTQKEFQYILKHQYALIGISDTSYNEDSTAIFVNFTPRFTIHHTLDFQRQQNIFSDVFPEDERYFSFNNTIYGFSPSDSVYGNQKWLKLDNKFGVSGTLGKNDNNVSLEVGIGNRFDRFNQAISADSNTKGDNYLSNYIYGSLIKEAQSVKNWNYGAHAQLYFTGPTAGNFLLNAHIDRVIKNIALLQLGFKQNLSAAPYYQQHYTTNFYNRTHTLNSYSVTNIWGNIVVPKLQTNIGLRNLLLANYIYLDSDYHWQQQAEAFNILQLNAKKDFKLGIFYSENEGIYQQATGNAPVNLPHLMLRHQSRIETPMFSKNLHFTLGVEVRYHTAYKGDGYVPYLNQFYYQNNYTLNNKPELMAFFNFKVKAFRAFIIFDHIQQLFWDNTMNAPHYPNPNTLFKFGFSWILYN
jgi:hypothetical protein